MRESGADGTAGINLPLDERRVQHYYTKAVKLYNAQSVLEVVTDLPQSHKTSARSDPKACDL